MSFRQNHTVHLSTVLAEADWETVLKLWNEGFPAEVILPSVEALQQIIEVSNCKHYTIRNASSDIQAWMAVFDRYNTRWFSILVSPEAQGLGMGSTLIQYAKTMEPCLEGWVVQSDTLTHADGSPYKSPLAFYKKLSFRLNPNRFPSDGKLDVVCVKWESDSLDRQVISI